MITAILQQKRIYVKQEISIPQKTLGTESGHLLSLKT